MDEVTKLTVEHYQKTYELTLHVWEQRNSTFLSLLAVVGAATVLTFNVPQAEPLLVDIIAKLADIKDTERLRDLRQSFPYGIVQSILLMTILYLMVILYHRTTFILRCYRYLAALEDELKVALQLPSGAIAFSREGSFYAAHKGGLAPFVAFVYCAMLGTLLVAFLGCRIYTDFTSQNYVIAVVDACLAAFTMLFYVGYARSV